jgi:predicted dehydrogenase
MHHEPLKVGIIGCGNIFQHYLKNAAKFPHLAVVACASRDSAGAEEKAAEYGLRAMGVDELIADREIGLIINLTNPAAHAEVSMRILEAGKHLYSEKPLATGLREGKAILDLAAAKSLRVGCAPDTILGDSHQACRRMIDAGLLGEVSAGTAFMMTRGPEAWHPSPFFFYEKGGGPMLDIGPYYISALVNFLGPVRSVLAQVRTSTIERVAMAGSNRGQKIEVAVPTSYAGLLDFHSGATITCNINWDTLRHAHSPIELYGSSGSLMMPDPNQFGGLVKVFSSGAEIWQDHAIPERYPFSCRLVGVADMAYAMRKDLPHVCSGELAYHVLEVMLAFETSARQGRAVLIGSSCQRPRLLSAHWD